MAHAQHRFDILELGPQRRGDLVHVATHEAGFVSLLDQARGDQAVSVREAGKLKLVLEVVAKGFFLGRDGLEIEIFRTLLARTGLGPVELRGRATDGAAIRGFGWAVILVDVVRAGIEFAARLVGAVGLIQPHLFAFFRRLFRRLAIRAFILGAGQQRVTLDLGLDVFGKFDVGELEQLDRLLQLRRHDKGLTLSQLQAMRERHR